MVPELHMLKKFLNLSKGVPSPWRILPGLWMEYQTGKVLVRLPICEQLDLDVQCLLTGSLEPWGS